MPTPRRSACLSNSRDILVKTAVAPIPIPACAIDPQVELPSSTDDSALAIPKPALGARDLVRLQVEWRITTCEISCAITPASCASVSAVLTGDDVKGIRPTVSRSKSNKPRSQPSHILRDRRAVRQHRHLLKDLCRYLAALGDLLSFSKGVVARWGNLKPRPHAGGSRTRHNGNQQPNLNPSRP